MTESSETPTTASSGTSPADADHSGGTAAPEESSISGIGDDQLPEDLQPTDDNPLAHDPPEDQDRPENEDQS